MNIEEQLIVEHSMSNSLKIVNYIGDDAVRFNDLFTLFIKNEPIISQRAAFALDHCCNTKPHLIAPHLSELIDNLIVPNQHDAIYRSSVRVLQDYKIPEDLQGKAIEYCYTLLRNYKQPIAVRAFSISVIYNITNDYPDLKPELLLTIQDLLDDDSPGLRNRSRKIYAKLKKEIALNKL